MEEPPLTLDARIGALELRLHFLLKAMKHITDGIDELSTTVKVLVQSETSSRLDKAIKHAKEPYEGKRKFVI